MATYTDFTLQPRKDLNSLSVVTDIEAINNSLKNIFSTPIGSLHGKPRFGTRLFQVLFNFIDFSTEEVIKEIVREEILKQEKRITLIGVNIQSIPEYNKIVIYIDYTFFAESLQSGTAKIGVNI